MFDKIDKLKDYSFGLSTDFGQSEIYSHVTRKLYKRASEDQRRAKAEKF